MVKYYGRVLTAMSQDTCLSNRRFIVKAVTRTEACWGVRDNLAPVFCANRRISLVSFGSSLASMMCIVIPPRTCDSGGGVGHGDVEGDGLRALGITGQKLLFGYRCHKVNAYWLSKWNT
ncbi:unnamed protein product [Rhizoctonia solani]|uniref:Uncharacterized protein n=1 Tax=Rhizoctonia solani TaxID=456999 RepID=A0A8H3D977_9AGAM|nr:unnamed protein product [Rhizoctonia solani]